LTACGGDDSDETAAAAARSPSNNAPPTISGTPGTTVTEGSAFSFQPTASDPDGDALIFGIDGRPDWLTFDTGTGLLSGTPTAADAGVYQGLVIWVSDGDAQALLPAFDLTVVPLAPTANTAPEIGGTPEKSVLVGNEYRFIPEATDADGDALSFTIRNRPRWAQFDRATGELRGTPTAADAGRHGNIVIAVSDGGATVTLAPFAIDVALPGGNTAPTIGGTPPGSVEVGGEYSFVPTASDADDDPLSFSVANAPPWATIDTQTGRLFGTPGPNDAGNYPGIVITVSDGATSASLPPFAITVIQPTTNTPPVIGGTPATSATQGQQYSFQPTASDADGDNLRFSIANRPGWASFSTSTGRLQGTPGASNVRTYNNIVISVSDGTATRSLPPFSITVAAANRAPTISGSPPTSATVGSQYTFLPSVADPDGDTLTFSIESRPSWATFSTTTGRLQGTPGTSHVRSYENIRISVSDGRGGNASLPAFTIAVAAANGAPTISGSPATSATVGSEYSFQPTASDPNGDTLTFSIQNRPSWANFNTSTGRLSGTPTAVGNHGNIVISVSDGRGGNASLPAFSITVGSAGGGNRAPTISGSPPAAVTAGQAYNFQPSASDPDDDDLTFTIQNRPSWAEFDTSTGRLWGTPDAGDVGNYGNIRITVSDGQATAQLPLFSIAVQSVATGSATLTWTPPTQNADGSPLTNLAGFKVYWGTTQGSYPNSVTINNPGVTSYVVENLVPGTWYFVTTAFNSSGVESNPSNVASKTIR